MRTLDRYLLAEIALPFGVGLGLFFAVVSFAQMLRVSDAVTGLGVTFGELSWALFYSLPPLVGLLVPVSVLFSCLLGVGRLAADREVIGMMAGGLGPSALMRVPFLVGLVMTFVAGGAVIWGEPWGIRGLRLLLGQSAQRALADGVRPGEFIEWIPGVVFYAAERHGHDLENVFFSDRQDPARPLLVTAQKGRLDRGRSPQDLIFVMQHGTLVLGNMTADKSRIVQFESAQYRLDVRQLVEQKGRNLALVQEMTMGQLWEAAHTLDRPAAERALYAVIWHRRLALSVACLIFALLAVPLAQSARSAARARGLLQSVAIVMAYYYLGRTLELAARAGRLPAPLAAWGPNGVGLVALCALWLRARRAGR